MPSLLDRLIDHEPTVTKEVASSRTQVLRELKQSVRRDLENLLNTRWRSKVVPPDLEELETSLVNYGIPDFTGMNLGAVQDRERYRRLLEACIRKYEPRFKKVQVQLLDIDSLERTLRFRVDAILHADSAPVIFDTAFEPSTGTFEVMGSQR
jgi:type VI secretion system protein ImpF